MKYKITFAVVFAVMSLSAHGEETGSDFFPFISYNDTLRLGVQETIFMALERNPSIAIQRLAPEAARTSIRQEAGRFDPSINIQGSTSENRGQRLLGTRPDPVDLQTERDNYSINIGASLPTGTNISISSGMSGQQSNLYADQATGSLGLTVTQSLLRGFGLTANLAQLRRAGLDYEISMHELKAFAEGMAANVEKAYWNLYLAEQDMIIREFSVELAEKQLHESLERVAVGRLADIELAAVEAEVATRRETLIDARSNYEKARLRLLYLLDPWEKNAISTAIEHIDMPFVPADNLDPLEVHEELALKYRPDILQARLELQKNELDVARTKNGLLPRLDLFVTLGRTSYATAIRDAVPDPNSPFQDKSVGFIMEIPVPNRTARAAAERAKISREQRKLSVSNMERLVILDVRTSYIEALRASRQINATRTTRELQERKLDAEVEKFRVGKSTNYLVLQAQADYVASLRDEARSMVTHLTALIDLYVMEGTLLERRGINSFAY